MEFFKTNTKIRFMQQRKKAAIVSAIIILISIVSLAINGLNLALDFTGGTQAEVVFQQPINVTDLRHKLQNSEFADSVVQAYSATDVIVRMGPQKNLSQEVLKQKLLQILPANATISSLEYIGPQVGKTLLTNGILAIIVCLLGTMIYIAFRFEFRFAVSAALALIHDPVAILGIFSLFHLSFDIIVLTGLLTVIGYSLNDTIVVYDRVRENFRKVRKGTPLEIMDLSINQTLSRTIMTSGLTLLVVVVLFIFGGATIHGFALAMIIGIIVGTYSSIYIAGSLAVAFGLNRSHLMPAQKRLVDDSP